MIQQAYVDNLGADDSEDEEGDDIAAAFIPLKKENYMRADVKLAVDFTEYIESCPSSGRGPSRSR
jgi:hypothetical protein